MVRPEDIRLYPMTMDVRGQRTHEEYVNEMADMMERIHCDYRIEWDTFHQLVTYAQQRRESY